ncbi:hypothetical protein ACFL27_26700 [candidate division CSSED10-310 bacterium]|uniref:Outer membrane protein beta-barrel domain-containing protein n=1 Tax=candidate division CSSED10-310 bacterium TaxID=2855610 RepID=A0ABV6Z5S3_UNCC1
MNKKLLILMIVFVFIASSPAFAIESFTLGLKYWYPTWELEDTEYDTVAGMFGPAATLVLSERVAVTMSLFVGQFEYSGTDYSGYDFSFESTRTDMDLAGAFIINQYVNVFGGIKVINFSETNSSSAGDVDQDLSAYGPGLGVGGNFPIGETRFSVYGTLAYTYLFGSFDVGDDSADLIYPIISFELGCTYSLENMPLVFAASYRYQQSSIDVEFDGGTITWDETFSGPILYAGYRFGG